MNDTPAFPPSNSRSDNSRSDNDAPLSPFTAAPPVDAPAIVSGDDRRIFPNDQPDPTTGDKEPDFPAERTIGIIGHLKKTTKSRRSGWLYMKIPASGSVPGASERPESSVPNGKGPVSDVRAYFAEELTDRGLDANAAPVVRSPEVAADGSREWAIWGGKGEPDRDAFEKVEVSSVAARAEALKAELGANELKSFAALIPPGATVKTYPTAEAISLRRAAAEMDEKQREFVKKEERTLVPALAADAYQTPEQVPGRLLPQGPEDGEPAFPLPIDKTLRDALRFTEAVKKWNESPAAKELAEFQAGGTPPQETYRPVYERVTQLEGELDASPRDTPRWAYTSKQPLDATSVRLRFGRPEARVIWDPSPEAPNAVAAIWLGEGPSKTVPFPLKNGGSREHAEALRDAALRSSLGGQLAVDGVRETPSQARVDAAPPEFRHSLKVKLGKNRLKVSGTNEFVDRAYKMFLEAAGRS